MPAGDCPPANQRRRTRENKGTALAAGRAGVAVAWLSGSRQLAADPAPALRVLLRPIVGGNKMKCILRRVGVPALLALLLYALRNADFNKIAAKLPVSKYMTPDDEAEEPGWFQVDVPLAHLGVANVTDFTDIVLSGPIPNVPFWIDDMKLVKPKGPAR